MAEEVILSKVITTNECLTDMLKSCESDSNVLESCLNDVSVLSEKDKLSSDANFLLTGSSDSSTHNSAVQSVSCVEPGCITDMKDQEGECLVTANVQLDLVELSDSSEDHSALQSIYLEPGHLADSIQITGVSSSDGSPMSNMDSTVGLESGKLCRERSASVIAECSSMASSATSSDSGCAVEEALTSNSETEECRLSEGSAVETGNDNGGENLDETLKQLAQSVVLRQTSDGETSDTSFGMSDNEDSAVVTHAKSAVKDSTNQFLSKDSDLLKNENYTLKCKSTGNMNSFMSSTKDICKVLDQSNFEDKSTNVKLEQESNEQEKYSKQIKTDSCSLVKTVDLKKIEINDDGIVVKQSLSGVETYINYGDKFESTDEMATESSIDCLELSYSTLSMIAGDKKLCLQACVKLVDIATLLLPALPQGSVDEDIDEFPCDVLYDNRRYSADGDSLDSMEFSNRTAKGMKECNTDERTNVHSQFSDYSSKGKSFNWNVDPGQARNENSYKHQNFSTDRNFDSGSFGCEGILTQKQFHSDLQRSGISSNQDRSHSADSYSCHSGQHANSDRSVWDISTTGIELEVAYSSSKHSIDVDIRSMGDKSNVSSGRGSDSMEAGHTAMPPSHGGQRVRNAFVKLKPMPLYIVAWLLNRSQLTSSNQVTLHEYIAAEYRQCTGQRRRRANSTSGAIEDKVQLVPSKLTSSDSGDRLEEHFNHIVKADKKKRDLSVSSSGSIEDRDSKKRKSDKSPTTAARCKRSIAFSAEDERVREKKKSKSSTSRKTAGSFKGINVVKDSSQELDADISEGATDSKRSTSPDLSERGKNIKSSVSAAKREKSVNVSVTESREIKKSATSSDGSKTNRKGDSTSSKAKPDNDRSRKSKHHATGKTHSRIESVCSDDDSDDIDTIASTQSSSRKHEKRKELSEKLSSKYKKPQDAGREGSSRAGFVIPKKRPVEFAVSLDRLKQEELERKKRLFGSGDSKMTNKEAIALPAESGDTMKRSVFASIDTKMSDPSLKWETNRRDVSTSGKFGAGRFGGPATVISGSSTMGNTQKNTPRGSFNDVLNAANPNQSSNRDVRRPEWATGGNSVRDISGTPDGWHVSPSPGSTIPVISSSRSDPRHATVPSAAAAASTCGWTEEESLRHSNQLTNDIASFSPIQSRDTDLRNNFIGRGEEGEDWADDDSPTQPQSLAAMHHNEETAGGDIQSKFSGSNMKSASFMSNVRQLTDVCQEAMLFGVSEEKSVKFQQLYNNIMGERESESSENTSSCRDVITSSSSSAVPSEGPRRPPLLNSPPQEMGRGRSGPLLPTPKIKTPLLETPKALLKSPDTSYSADVDLRKPESEGLPNDRYYEDSLAQVDAEVDSTLSEVARMLAELIPALDSAEDQARVLLALSEASSNPEPLAFLQKFISRLCVETTLRAGLPTSADTSLSRGDIDDRAKDVDSRPIETVTLTNRDRNSLSSFHATKPAVLLNEPRLSNSEALVREQLLSSSILMSRMSAYMGSQAEVDPQITGSGASQIISRNNVLSSHNAATSSKSLTSLSLSYASHEKLLSDAQRQEQEVLRRRRAEEEELRMINEERLRKTEEQEKLRRIAEEERLRKLEEEKLRRTEEFEKLRKAAEQEKLKRTEELEKLRRAEELEKLRRAQEQERLRRSEELEKLRKAEEQEIIAGKLMEEFELISVLLSIQAELVEIKKEPIDQPRTGAMSTGSCDADVSSMGSSVMGVHELRRDSVGLNTPRSSVGGTSATPRSVTTESFDVSTSSSQPVGGASVVSTTEKPPTTNDETDRTQKQSTSSSGPSGECKTDQKAQEEQIISVARKALKPHYRLGKITADEYKNIVKKTVIKVKSCKTNNWHEKDVVKLIDDYVTRITQTRVGS